MILCCFGNTNVKIGDLSIDPKKRSITFPAKINQHGEIAEFLLVHETGKTHEALFSCATSAVQLNAALNLLGLKSNQDNQTVIPALPSLEKLPTLKVLVSTDQKKWHLATDYITYKGSKEPPSPHPWRYTGSYFYKDKFMAQVEGDLIAIYTSINALITMNHPDRKDDLQWFSNTKVLGKKGDLVYLKIRVDEK